MSCKSAHIHVCSQLLSTSIKLEGASLLGMSEATNRTWQRANVALGFKQT